MAGSSSNNEEQASGQDNGQLAVELILKPECPADLDLRSLPHWMALELYKELNEDDKYIKVAEYLAPIIHYGEDWIKSLAIPNYREPHKTPAQRLIEEMNCKGGDVGVLHRVLSDLNMFGALSVICQPVRFKIIRHPHDAFGKKKRKIYIRHGDTISIKCEAFGLPPPRYQWYLNDDALEGQTRSTLTITMTKSSQVGMYQCVVRQVDQHGDSTREEKSRGLRIDMSPISVRVTEQPPSSVQVNVGGTLKISCGAIGYPENLLFQWYRNNDLIHSHYPDKEAAQENNDVDDDNDNNEPKAWNYNRSVLQIDNCQIEDTALYTCRVSNSVSDDHSHQTHVWVSSPLPILRGKVALVIANQQYKYHEPLATAKADAKLVALALKQIGFTVMVFEDLTKQQMIKAFEIFGTYLNDGYYGFFYYVGHGYRIQENYILPIDAPEYFDHSHDISESTLLTTTLVANPTLLVTVLDMCQDSIDPKDNPELYREAPTTTSWSNGVGIQWNLLQAYSTSYYRPAFEDTESDNGIYASSLGSLLPLEDIPVNQLFEKLGQKVGLAMRGKLHYQIPMYSTSVTQPFKLIELPHRKYTCAKINKLSESLKFSADCVVDLEFAPQPASGRAHIKLHMDIFQNSVVVQLKDLVEPWDKASIVNERDESTRDIARVLNNNTWYINNPRAALLVKVICGKNDTTTAVLDVLAYLPGIILELNEITADEMIAPVEGIIIPAPPRPPPAPHTIAPPTRENGCAIWATAMPPNSMPAPDDWSLSDEENVTNRAYSQRASNWMSDEEYWSDEYEKQEPKVEVNNGGAEEEQVDNGPLGEVKTPLQSPEKIKRVQWKDKSSPIYTISNNDLVLTPSNVVQILAENNAGPVDQVQQLPTNSTDEPEQLPELNGSTTEMANRSNDAESAQNDAKSVDKVQLPSNSSDKSTIVPKLIISAPEMTNGSAPEITNGSNACQNLTLIRDPRISSQNVAKSVDQVQQLPTNSTVTPKIVPKLQTSAPEMAKGSAPEITNGSNAYQNLTLIRDLQVSSQNDARSLDKVQLPSNSSDKPKIVPKLIISAPEMTNGSAPEITNASNAYQNFTPIRDPRISSQNVAKSVDQVQQLPTNSTVTPKIVPKLQTSAPEMAKGSAPEITNGSNAYQNLTLIRDLQVSSQNDARSVDQVQQLPTNSTVTPKIVPKLKTSAPEKTNGSIPEMTNGSALKMTNGSNGHQNSTPSGDLRILSQNNARSVYQAYKSLYESPQVTTLPPKGKPLTLPPNNTRSVNQTLQISQNANEMPSRSPTLNRSPEVTLLSPSSQPLASPLSNAGSVIHPQQTPPNPNEMPNPTSRPNRSPSVLSLPLSSNSTTLTPSKIKPIDKLLPSPENPDDMRNASQRYAESSPIIVRRMWSGGNVTVTPIGTPIPSPRDSPMTPINIFASNLVSLNLTPSNSSTQNAVIEQTPPPITEMTPVFVNRMSGGSVTVSPVETPTEESKSIAFSTSSDLPASSSKDTESVDQAKNSPQNSTLSPKNAESVDQTEKLPQTSTDTPKRSSIFGKVVRKVSWGSDSTPKNTESVDQTKKSPQNSIDTPKRSSMFGKVIKKVSRGSDSTPKNKKSVDEVKKSPQKSIDTSNGSPGLNGSPPATRSPSNDL
ncbi:mucin-5AC-like isoform X2 [Trichogramma pretiosum]|uniref:mucin-5AC-like isoform X2 n=1 Tax=Trichogramma pretiosum TaxID=7493 RepID=UPI000C718AD8|nr:mucin-5AC-like isoform X2 [Trichogramma pretiosum]